MLSSSLLLIYPKNVSHHLVILKHFPRWRKTWPCLLLRFVFIIICLRFGWCLLCLCVCASWGFILCRTAWYTKGMGREWRVVKNKTRDPINSVWQFSYSLTNDFSIFFSLSFYFIKQLEIQFKIIWNTQTNRYQHQACLTYTHLMYLLILAYF